MNQPANLPQATAQRDDEIDLAELFAKIWKRKLWVVACTLVVTAMALAYVLLAKPIYKAELFLMPPGNIDLQPLNIKTDQLVYQITPEAAYKRVLDQLRSKEQIATLFFDKGLSQAYRSSDEETEQELFEIVEKALSVNLPKTGEVVFTSVSLEGPAADLVADLLNHYVGQVSHEVVSTLVADIVEERDRKVTLIQGNIDTKRALAKMQREDRIAQLEEALVVAREVGLEKLGSSAGNTITGQNINIVNADTLFMRGTDALGAEIEVLKSRTSDDPFIVGLRDMQEAIVNLKAISVDVSAVRSVKIDRQAVVPEKPIKPKKRLIVAVAIVLGGMLGLFVALLVPSGKEETAV